MISNWVNIADCVCIQGCHGLAGFSSNPPHTLNPHRLIWHFFRVLGHQARKLCLPDRQVIMFNKIPTSLHFPLLFPPLLHSAVFFSAIQPSLIHVCEPHLNRDVVLYAISTQTLPNFSPHTHDIATQHGAVETEYYGNILISSVTS